MFPIICLRKLLICSCLHFFFKLFCSQSVPSKTSPCTCWGGCSLCPVTITPTAQFHPLLLKGSSCLRGQGQTSLSTGKRSCCAPPSAHAKSSQAFAASALLQRPGVRGGPGCGSRGRVAVGDVWGSAGGGRKAWKWGNGILTIGVGMERFAEEGGL